MRLLSLDMSTTSSGWAIFDDKELIAYGCIKAKKDEKDFRFRVKYMTKRVSEIIEEYKPDRVVAEDIPLKKGTAKVTLMLGVLQGSVLGLCASHDLFIDFISVSQWRSKLGLFDGTQEGKQRTEMKRKSIEYANKTFGLELVYKSPSSSLNEDDISDSVNIGWSVVGVEEKEKKSFGRKSKIN